VTAEVTAELGSAPVRRVHPITPLLRSGLVVLAVGSWLLRNLLEGQSETRALLIVPVALLGALLLGLASWWFTRFRISADELRIDSGVLVRRQRRVRIERIQAVEVEQPLLARLTGMAELRIEVAGGDGAKLAYLSLREAEALRRTLLEEARTGPAPDLPAWQPVLFRVDDGRLLAATFLRSDVVSLVAVVVVAGSVSVVMAQPGGLAAVFPSAVAAVGVAWKSFTSGYATTLTRAEHGLRLRAGMLDVRTQSVPTGRVQGVVVVEPVLWRLLGWARVDVTVAGRGRWRGWRPRHRCPGAGGSPNRDRSPVTAGPGRSRPGRRLTGRSTAPRTVGGSVRGGGAGRRDRRPAAGHPPRRGDATHGRRTAAEATVAARGTGAAAAQASAGHGAGASALRTGLGECRPP
jgi:membrane protein YdbS with pleckstrin-like domain